MKRNKANKWMNIKKTKLKRGSKPNAKDIHPPKPKTILVPPKRKVGRPKKQESILLTEQEQCFADLIMENMHRSNKNKMPQYQCYQKAFPRANESSARVLSSKLIKKETIQDYIQARKKAAAKRVELNVEMVLRGLLRIALFDPRKLYKENGHMKKIIELDDDTALGIHGIKFSNMYIGKGDKKRIKSVLDSVQTESRKAAWELLGTHINMWTGDTSTSPEEFVTDVRSFANSIENAIPGGKI